MIKVNTILGLGSLLLLATPPFVRAQESGPALEVQHVRGGVYMISGNGGNIAVFLGEDGIFQVDAGYAELAEETLSLIRETAAGAGANPEFRFLVNTHWHFDHTEGNRTFAAAGATLIAHEMVFRGLGEKRIMEALGGLEQGPVPPDARPILSFNDRVNLAWNGDLIHMVHMPGAHSDGDVMVHFRDADVVHTGDLFFNIHYPFIDVDYGGNLEGIVRALDDIQSHTLPTALYIPGHGPLATRSELEAYTDMLRTVAERVRTMVGEGLTREEVIQARPTAEFDEVWGASEGFAVPDFWVGLVYDGMVRADARNVA